MIKLWVQNSADYLINLCWPMLRRLFIAIAQADAVQQILPMP
jgi:hypothetical protein